MLIIEDFVSYYRQRFPNIFTMKIVVKLFYMLKIILVLRVLKKHYIHYTAC